MINKLLNFKVFALLIVVLILAGGFYWFQFRPSQIRAECGNRAKEKGNDSFSAAKSIKELDDYYDLVYKACIQERGLK